MEIVYICSPFTAPTAWQVECNVRRAELAALEVIRLGAWPICPHANTRFFHGEVPAELAYEGTLELLRRCDAILLLDGWRDSKGCVAEVAEAQRLGIPEMRLGSWLNEDGNPMRTRTVNRRRA